jgi:hypothetical protein
MLAGWLAAAGGTALAFSVAGGAAIAVTAGALALVRAGPVPGRLGRAPGTVHA